MPNTKERQLRALETQLAEREDAVREDIRRQSLDRAEASRDMIENVGDDADKSVADLIVHVDNALIGQQLMELRRISAARQRMQEGTYGYCLDCGLEIDHRRLVAYPTATRCALCQGVRERTFASPVHSSL
jgi:RNA polymerase-binding transcription factor DksA